MKIQYTWQHFDDDIKLMMDNIAHSTPWDVECVYALSNGIAFGYVIARKLDVPFFTNLEDALNHAAHPHDINEDKRERILIVNDFSSTGKSFLAIHEIFKFKTSALFMRHGSQFIPNSFCRHCQKEDKIVFPWERLGETK